MTGDELRVTRLEMGLSQMAMARILGYKRAASISDIETGKKVLTLQAKILLSILSDNVYLSAMRK